jgi:triosephosphate isomerase
MSLPRHHFLVNFKVYPGTAGEDGLEFARTVDRVADETDTNLAVAPQTPDLRMVARQVSVPVVAQALDPVPPGRGNGAILPEAVAGAGARCAFVNHPESPADLGAVPKAIRRCREVGLETIVAVDGVELGRAVASLSPDWLLFEEPEDIEGEKPMVRSDPDRVREFLEVVHDVDPGVRVFVGGGIASPEDVAAAFELGVDATGAASAFVGADDPESWLRAVAGKLPDDGGPNTGT